MKKILICGHRGFPAKFPQNTLPSFAGAVAVGCDRIEYDLHWTADRKLVVCHNDTVDSTSDGTGKIADMTFGEIRKLDFGRWKDERFAGTPIPEFREVLELTAKLAPQLFHLVELKVDSIDYAEDVLRELSRYKMAGKFTLVSFHLELLREIKKRHPEVLIHGNPSTRLQEFDYEEYRIFDSVGLHRNNVTAAVVSGFHSVGTLVDAWTVDTAEEFRKQVAHGVDSVTSNDPATVLAERDRPSNRLYDKQQEKDCLPMCETEPDKKNPVQTARKPRVTETEYRPLTFADLKFLCRDEFRGDENLHRFMNRDAPVNADQWCNILTAYPDFVGECDLGQLKERHWKSILAEQPQLAEHCPHREWTENVVPWEESFDPASVPREKLLDDLIFHPVHAKYCNWSHLSGFVWMNLLLFHPEFISCCNLSRLTGNRKKTGYADTLLALQPQWAKHFELAVDLMDPGAFLKKHPEYMDGCDWGKIGYHGWLYTLSSYPELLEHCDLSRFPVLPRSKRGRWEKGCALGILNPAWMFGPRAARDRGKFHDLIVQAVRRNPEYLEKWNRYTEFMCQDELPSLRRLGNFLAEYPELYPLCRREWLTSRDLAVEKLGDFLKWHPEMIRMTDPKKLPVKVWCESLRRYPELAEICTIWNRFSARDWLYLLGGSSKPYSADWAKPKPDKRVLPFSTVLPNPYSDEEVRIQPHPEFFSKCPKRIYKEWTQAFEWRYLLDAGCPVEDLIPAEFRAELEKDRDGR